MTLNGAAVLRLIACICFALAVFGVSPGGLSAIAVGLLCWCASTFV